MSLDLVLQVVSVSDALPSEQDFRRWLNAVLTTDEQRGDYEISLRIVDEEESRALNARFRDKDYPTNVLSFPYEGPEGLPEETTAVLGDMVICAPVVERESSEQGKPGEAHWAHMTVHGTLHLLGYDHQDERQANEMESLETEILGGLGIGDPYVEN